MNVICGTKEERLLLSGLHVVCDIFCKGCNSLIGWKYVKWCFKFHYYVLLGSSIGGISKI